MIPDSNEVRIEVSTLCNYVCPICPREGMVRRKEIMPVSLFQRIMARIKDHPQYKTITFSGIGEPLTDLDIRWKLAVAHGQGYETLLLTNGSLLTTDKIKELNAFGLKSVRVSFYGMSPETYASAHGVGEEAFELVKANVLEACDSDLEVILTYNIIPGINEHEMEEWIEYWKDKADLLEVWHPHNWVYGKKYREVQEEKLKTCGRPFNGPLQIQVDGTVIMCCFDYEGKLELGDLKTQTLNQIFIDEPYRSVKENHSCGVHTTLFGPVGRIYTKLVDTICADCDQLNANKSDIMVYSSEHDLEERVTLTSTTYRRVGR